MKPIWLAACFCAIFATASMADDVIRLQGADPGKGGDPRFQNFRAQRGDAAYC
jgi:hypothetical protein